MNKPRLLIGIGILASIFTLINPTIAIAAPPKVPTPVLANNRQDDPLVGSKVRKEIQYIYEAIDRHYLTLNDERYDVKTASGGCSYSEVKSLTLDSLTKDQAELTVVYNRYGCGLLGTVNSGGGMYLYNIDRVDLFVEKISVRKENGAWKV